MEKGDKCPCGAPLPWHLFELGIGGYEHICSCERSFKKVDGVVTEGERQVNPIARFDRGGPPPPEAKDR